MKVTFCINGVKIGEYDESQARIFLLEKLEDGCSISRSVKDAVTGNLYISLRGEGR